MFGNKGTQIIMMGKNDYILCILTGFLIFESIHVTSLGKELHNENNLYIRKRN